MTARPLEHPLPEGMRDLLPEEAAARRQLARALLDRFALWGYRAVAPPAFELADVALRGLGALAPSDVLRFIEPASGEVAVFRPDMTPQIARIVATRLEGRPPPYRLAYDGTVVRRRVGRAKKHRQIPQVGVELCGLAAGEGDVELLTLAAEALRASGLAKFTIELSDACIVHALLEGAAPEQAAEVAVALSRKDEARLAEIAADLPHREALRALPRLAGGRDALLAARTLLEGTPAAAAAERLLALFDAASSRGLAQHLNVDVGEVRDLGYYTGATFAVYARGPGERIGAGGRYDELLARFGRAMPAAGFAIDLDALASALEAEGRTTSLRAGVVVTGPDAAARVAALRALGLGAVAVAALEDARAYARAWSFAAVWNDAELERVADVPADAASHAVSPAPSAAAVAAVLEALARGA